MTDPANFWSDQFYINSYPITTTHDGSRVVPTMRNRKMVFLIFQKWFTGIGDDNFLQWKIRKQGRQ